jgi:serine/threonine-protein kinase PpkA
VIGLTEKETIKIFKKIAGALQYAHSRRVIHRDIKPANILFRRDGTPVLTDFGLARMVDSQTRFTKTGTIMGTPAYMSPEQCRGKKANHMSDIYNLGVVLFEMLTGGLPYRAHTNFGMFEMHKNAPIPLLPPGLKRYQPLIKCMLAKDKKRRISSARQVSFILDELSSRRRKKEPKDTTEILSARGSFLHSHKRWILPLLLLMTTVALLVVIVLIFKMGCSTSKQVGKSHNTENTSTITRSYQSPLKKSMDNGTKSVTMEGKFYLQKYLIKKQIKE